MKINVTVTTVTTLARHLADVVYPNALATYSVALQNTKLQLQASIVTAIGIELELALATPPQHDDYLPVKPHVIATTTCGFAWELKCIEVDLLIKCYNHAAKGCDVIRDLSEFDAILVAKCK